jgi:MFS family permease
VRAKSAERSPFRAVYTKPFLIAVALCFFQQMGGTSAFLAIVEQFFEESDNELSAKFAMVLVGLAGVSAAVCGSWFVGVFGRKITWILSSILQCATLAVGGLQQLREWPRLVFVVCIFLNNFAFCVGTAGIAWFYVCEQMPDSVRSAVTGNVAMMSWIFGALFLPVWDGMKKSIGQSWGLIVFAGIMLGSTLFGFLLKEPPETMGEGLENADEKGATNTALLVVPYT